MQASVFCAASLDGYIARKDDSLDWLDPYTEPHGYEEFIASVDAILIGRRTFDIVLGFGGWHYTKPVFVLSHTLKSLNVPKQAQCELLAGDPSEILARLEQRGFQHLYVDGGIVIQEFLRAGLITRMTITRIPILLGRGIPLFGDMEKEIQLRHTKTQSYQSGLVQSTYELLR